MSCIIQIKILIWEKESDILDTETWKENERNKGDMLKKWKKNMMKEKN